ncbi:ImmA/IrrE family metallo-endopeptidase [Lactiplantibacillus sp. WILCCON 0030]|uniref:ImmA/IrrE family metallo-endopeptidase n=1 Tax=Lactiplantibacillus brownii TaxID=3069269 RepID=A0ABU1A933_9LACO|nr:ImmA/IrrE family metallo-endopeptidase [Lactiplantibacillus brownii]MDQ7936952.1 ImmA/IrrE family metallo-endopeptidase [Lactiplantibacillus brownii]
MTKEKQMARVQFSEMVAEYAANSFLIDNVGLDLFIGADIEKFIAQNAQVIYQNIDDANFSGALIHYRGKVFVALNTNQSLRMRYYSAAHEMCHLAFTKSLFGSDSKKLNDMALSASFDEERAADHFAAAVMLPKDAVTKIWDKYVQNQPEPPLTMVKEAVIRIANVSSVPYTAVFRRLTELNLLSNHQLIKWDETHWQTYLAQSDFPPSLLDQKIPFKQFSGLADFVQAMVETHQMTFMEAANLLTDSDPQRALKYLNLRQEQVERLASEDDDE